jgi:hypothetical protein
MVFTQAVPGELPSQGALVARRLAEEGVSVTMLSTALALGPGPGHRAAGRARAKCVPARLEHDCLRAGPALPSPLLSWSSGHCESQGANFTTKPSREPALVSCAPPNEIGSAKLPVISTAPVLSIATAGSP